MMRLSNTVVILVLAVMVISCGNVRNSITVVNHSGVKADRVTVTVCGQDVVFEDIDAGAKVSQSFLVSGDSGFLVSASLSDGTVATHSFGYVTGGAGSYGNHAEIEIAPDKSINGKQL